MSSNVVQSPEDFLGYKVGTDRKTANWPEIVEYFTKLGGASPRVVVEDLGETTEGNPFILATITSEENHAKIDELREGESVAWYPEADPLISGWVLGERHLRGRAAVAEVPAGDGVIIMIGCPPHFRNQNRATFKLLFNSIYYGSS